MQVRRIFELEAEGKSLNGGLEGLRLTGQEVAEGNHDSSCCVKLVCFVCFFFFCILQAVHGGEHSSLCDAKSHIFVVGSNTAILPSKSAVPVVRPLELQCGNFIMSMPAMCCIKIRF